MRFGIDTIIASILVFTATVLLSITFCFDSANFTYSVKTSTISVLELSKCYVFSSLVSYYHMMTM